MRFLSARAHAGGMFFADGVVMTTGSPLLSVNESTSQDKSQNAIGQALSSVLGWPWKLIGKFTSGVTIATVITLQGLYITRANAWESSVSESVKSSEAAVNAYFTQIHELDKDISQAYKEYKDKGEIPEDYLASVMASQRNLTLRTLDIISAPIPSAPPSTGGPIGWLISWLSKRSDAQMKEQFWNSESLRDGIAKKRIVRYLYESDLSDIEENGNSYGRSKKPLRLLYASFYSGANLNKADLGDMWLPYTNFSRTQLQSASFKNAYLKRSSFKKADLKRADFSCKEPSATCTLEEANLSEAILVGANLSGAILVGADLAGADLAGIRWDEKTEWPAKGAFKGTKNIPPKLKQQLGL
jgi:uncharacterized protein YjbI with pentapeptide repeats